MIKVCSGDLAGCDIYGVRTGQAGHLEKWYPGTKLESRGRQAQRIMTNSGFPHVWDGSSWNFSSALVDEYMEGHKSRRTQTKLRSLGMWTE